MAIQRPLLARHIAPRLEAALDDTPVVLVVGPRQSGKTTLCGVVGRKRGARFLSLDDAATSASARTDPAGFVASLEGPTILDEIQNAPELLRSIKLDVDRRREPGRFLLTGSADVLALPRVSESLAGRMEVLTLWPLSQGEIAQRPERFIDAAFGGSRPSIAPGAETRRGLIERALLGGYPEVITRRDGERRRAWFASYVTTILQRDVRDLARIDSLADLPRLLSLLAARSGTLLNIAEVSRSISVPHTTLARYLALLEQMFLVRRIPAWAGNRARRLMKTPRVLLTDTGLLGHVAGVTPARLAEEPAATGPLLESFVGVELLRQIAWSEPRVALLHFRTHAGREVDFVLERDDGRVVGIEVKAAATVGDGDFRGLRAFRETAAKRFHRGIVLHAGHETLPFGEGMWAMPIGALWTAAGRAGAGSAQEPGQRQGP